MSDVAWVPAALVAVNVTTGIRAMVEHSLLARTLSDEMCEHRQSALEDIRMLASTLSFFLMHPNQRWRFGDHALCSSSSDGWSRNVESS